MGASEAPAGAHKKRLPGLARTPCHRAANPWCACPRARPTSRCGRCKRWAAWSSWWARASRRHRSMLRCGGGAPSAQVHQCRPTTPMRGGTAAHPSQAPQCLPPDAGGVDGPDAHLAVRRPGHHCRARHDWLRDSAVGGPLSVEWRRRCRECPATRGATQPMRRPAAGKLTWTGCTPFSLRLVSATHARSRSRMLLHHPSGPPHAGGGGLAAGVAAYVKALRPHVKVIGVEPTGSNAMAQSLARGERVSLSYVDGFAGGQSCALARGGCAGAGDPQPCHAPQMAWRSSTWAPRPFGSAVRCWMGWCSWTMPPRRKPSGCANAQTCRWRAVHRAIHAFKLVISRLVSSLARPRPAQDVFNETRSILEPAGAVAVAGAKAYVQHSGLAGQTLVAVTSGGNMDFEDLVVVAGGRAACWGAHGRKGNLGVGRLPERGRCHERQCFCAALAPRVQSWQRARGWGGACGTACGSWRCPCLRTPPGCFMPCTLCLTSDALHGPGDCPCTEFGSQLSGSDRPCTLTAPTQAARPPGVAADSFHGALIQSLLRATRRGSLLPLKPAMPPAAGARSTCVPLQSCGQPCSPRGLRCLATLLVTNDL